MIKLIQSGLFGEGLIKIDVPSQVKRYNDCLEDIGLVPTKLTQFHIDGWGWSPEIAEEQRNQFYHSHGFANPYSIIITPEQANSSLYFPFHSFDWDIHKEVFTKYKRQIEDITTQCGMWYELDQEMSAYRSPQDLLMVESIQLKFKSVDGLMQAAMEQRELVRQFYEEEDAWANQELRNEIMQSSKSYGDLRFRQVEISGFPYNNIGSFYSPTFGGIYILKNTPAVKPVLILKDSSSKVSGEMQHAHIEFNLNDPKLLSFLYGNKLIGDDLEFFYDHPGLLEHQMDLILIRASMQLDRNLGLTELSEAKKKGLVNKALAKKLLGDDYFQLEQIYRRVRNGMKAELPSDTSIRNLLLHPKPYLDPATKAVLWQLLSALLEHNEVLAYTFDKPSFYTAYRTWDANYQSWVIEQILKNKGIYNRIMN